MAGFEDLTHAFEDLIRGARELDAPVVKYDNGKGLVVVVTGLEEYAELKSFVENMEVSL